MGRPTQAEAARLDERLRKAAIETFLAHGFDAATMEAIAHAAGITKRTLYARFPDKHALFAAVIPWALSRHDRDELEPAPDGEDLAAALTRIARSAVKRAVDPEIVRLTRVARNESARFPEFAMSARSLTWSPRLRAVIELLRRHEAAGEVVVDDAELAAEQFLAMVAVMPARLADFGVFRTRREEERHVRHAVALFLRGILPRDPTPARSLRRHRRA
jgi:TetR/AcrR family transcriptional regulator, mexJK operon transcriptional repressor